MSDNEKKHHYRAVFKSDHLGVADLEEFIEIGQPLVFTITHVNQEFGAKVAGKKIDCNVAYFKEDIKPWVLNAGNSKIIKKLAGGSVYVEDWKPVTVTLYIDPNAKLKGEKVGGVRVRPDAPKMTKSILEPGTKFWENAIVAYNRDGNLKKVEERMIIPEDIRDSLIKEANAAKESSDE